METGATEFSVHAVSAAERVATFRVAAVGSMVSLSLPTFITGIEVAEGVGATDALPVIGIGAAIIFVIGALMGYIGARTGFNSYLLVRLAFGDTGAKLVNTAFAISLLGWFGVNVNLLGAAVSGLAAQLGAYTPGELLVTVLASALITLTTVMGFRAINALASLLVPVLLVIVALLLNAVLGTDFALSDSTPAETTISWGAGISAIVGSIIVGAIIMPDITRFLRTPNSAFTVTGLAYLLVQPAVMIIAVLASVALGATDMIDIMVAVGLGTSAFIIVIASSWILNALNLYSAVLGLTASFPRLRAVPTTLVLGALGAVAGIAQLLDSFLAFLFYLSVVFIPVAGVIIVDVLAIRPDRFRQTTVSAGQATNLPGLIAWVVGAVFALAAAESLLPSLTEVATLDAVLISATLYWVLSTTFKSRFVSHAHRH